MVNRPLPPTSVMPPQLSDIVDDLEYWFVIGGQAVRCFCPYRPSRDVDFGVGDAKNFGDLQDHLQNTGKTEVLERSEHTVHMIWNGIKVSVFILDLLQPHTEDRRLTVNGVLATKLHAILDRGTRRDFFDLYVMLQQHRLGIAACMEAMREVYGQQVQDGLLLRALTYFEDADAEAPLQGEGERDWKMVQDFFITRVGQLLTPPGPVLEIQHQRVDIRSTLAGMAAPEK